jgi:hypothetical protein
VSSPLEIIKNHLGDAALAAGLLAALRDGGFVCVPEEATEQMLDDAWGEICDENGRASWRAMVASALANQARETREA